MSEGLDFGVTLSDQMSPAAGTASKSLGDLTKSITETKKELGLFQQQLALSKQIGDVDGYRKYTAAIDDHRKKLFGLNEALPGAKRSESEFASTIEESVTSHLSLASALKTVIGLEVAFAGALGAAAIAGSLFAIEQTQDKLAVIATFDALSSGVETGRELEDSFSNLSDKIGIAKSELIPLAQSFMAMGIEGEDALKKVTLAAESAKALNGDKAAQSFENLTRKIQTAVETGNGLKIPAKGLGSLLQMGIKVDDVAQKMGVSAHDLSAQLKAGSVNAAAFGDALQDSLITKGEKPLALMQTRLGNIKKMLEQHVGDLFEDMDNSVQPFAASLVQLESLFSQNTASGEALKGAVGGAFSFIIDKANESIEPIEIFFLNTIIMSQRAYITILEHWTAVKVGFYSVAGSIGAVVDQFTLLASPMTTAVNLALKFSSALGAADALAGKVASGAAGSNVASGLANGILDGKTDVVDAGKGLGDAAVGGVTTSLGIKSPSTVMFDQGQYTGQGMALGMESETPRVSEAAGKISAAAASGGGGASGDGGGGPMFGSITINVNAPDGATTAMELTETAVAALFERFALQWGT